jgi:hypothetical protein
MNDTSKVLAAPTSAPPTEAFQQAIRERAYLIWEREGRPAGRSIANWLQAEAEFKQHCDEVGEFVRSWADVVPGGQWRIARHLS